MPGLNTLLPPFRSLSTQLKKPLIAIGPGSAASFLEMEAFKGKDVNTANISREIYYYLKGGRDKIEDMSPRQISNFTNVIADDVNADGYIFAGSRNTMPLFFQLNDFDLPNKLDEFSARSIFKMALTKRVLEDETSSILSCNALPFAIRLLGGQISNSPTCELINHHDGYHAVIIKEESWLGRRVREKMPDKNFHGDIVVKNVSSTHPLITNKLPKGVEELATALDGSTAAVSILRNSIGIVDHPESEADLRTPGRSPKLRELESDLYARKGDNLEAKEYFDIVLDALIEKAGSQEKPSTSISPKFDARILDILDAPSTEAFNATHIPMRTYGKGK